MRNWAPPPPARRYAPGMKDIGEEFAARAAVFRRLAAELRSEEDRLALLAVAEEYEAESERLKASPGPL
ncbi:MAG TPA: hypothetical protein VF652_05235 [Allosphingosinicella sp.]